MEKENRAIRYRVYPTEKQQDILQQTFGCARLVFNETLLMHRGLSGGGDENIFSNGHEQLLQPLHEREYAVSAKCRQIRPDK